MDTQHAAELKAALVGVELPARKRELLAYAASQGADAGALRRVPDKEYESLDEVVDELIHVQPPDVESDAQEPHVEAGRPPGGDDYTR